MVGAGWGRALSGEQAARRPAAGGRAAARLAAAAADAWPAGAYHALAQRGHGPTRGPAPGPAGGRLPACDLGVQVGPPYAGSSPSSGWRPASHRSVLARSAQAAGSVSGRRHSTRTSGRSTLTIGARRAARSSRSHSAPSAGPSSATRPDAAAGRVGREGVLAGQEARRAQADPVRGPGRPWPRSRRPASRGVRRPPYSISAAQVANRVPGRDRIASDLAWSASLGAQVSASSQNATSAQSPAARMPVLRAPASPGRSASSPAPGRAARRRRRAASRARMPS